MLCVSLWVRTSVLGELVHSVGVWERVSARDGRVWVRVSAKGGMRARVRSVSFSLLSALIQLSFLEIVAGPITIGLSRFPRSSSDLLPEYFADNQRMHSVLFSTKHKFFFVEGSRLIHCSGDRTGTFQQLCKRHVFL